MARAKALIIIAIFLRLFLALFSTPHPDIGNHLDWGEKMWQLETRWFYENTFWKVSTPNQPFGTMYLFALTNKLHEFTKNILFGLNDQVAYFPSFIFPFLDRQLPYFFAKLPFIISDLLLGLLLYKITQQKKYLYLYVFNPALIYNSAVWGQTDSLINFLFLLSFYLLQKNKYFFSILLLFLCFSIKLSLIIFIPIYLIYLIKQKPNYINLAKNTILVLGLFILAVLPHSRERNPISWIRTLYEVRVVKHQGSMLNGNAFNFWAMTNSLDFSLNQDSIFILNQTYQTVGKFIFLVLLTPVLIKINKKNIYQAFFLTYFLGFMFLTNMHERYLYPIFPFFILILQQKKAALRDYLIITTIHLLNLYNIWNYPYIPTIKILLESNNFLTARVFSLVLLIFLVKYYKEYIYES